MSGSLAAAPFTAGATIPGVVAGAAALTGGEIISVLIILYAGSIPIIAMLKNYDAIETTADVYKGFSFKLKRKSDK